MAAKILELRGKMSEIETKLGEVGLSESRQESRSALKEIEARLCTLFDLVKANVDQVLATETEALTSLWRSYMALWTKYFPEQSQWCKRMDTDKVGYPDWTGKLTMDGE